MYAEIYALFLNMYYLEFMLLLMFSLYHLKISIARIFTYIQYFSLLRLFYETYWKIECFFYYDLLNNSLIA